MPAREEVKAEAFNKALVLPYELRLQDFSIAMQDVYDFFYDVNELFQRKGLPRLEEVLRSANMSGTISDMLTASLAKHSRSLGQNQSHNGHPDLIVRGRYVNDAVRAGQDGVEIKNYQEERRRRRYPRRQRAVDVRVCVRSRQRY